MAGWQTVWQEVEELLLEAKQRIADEIAFYPPPIPACDAQFNYLLEQRAQIAEAVWGWRQIVATTAVNDAQTFLATTNWLTDEQRETLLGSIQAVEPASQ